MGAGWLLLGIQWVQADDHARPIAVIDPAKATVRELRYPPEMVAADRAGFDGSFTRAAEYSGREGKYTVATWESGPGDRFVIPKGWAGTWDMKTRFRKRYVAWEPE